MAAPTMVHWDKAPTQDPRVLSSNMQAGLMSVSARNHPCNTKHLHEAAERAYRDRNGSQQKVGLALGMTVCWVSCAKSYLPLCIALRQVPTGKSYPCPVAFQTVTLAKSST